MFQFTVGASTTSAYTSDGSASAATSPRSKNPFLSAIYCGAVRRYAGNIKYGIIGCLDITGRQAAAVVKVPALWPEGETVMEGRQRLPIREHRRHPVMFVKIHEALIQQPVDALGDRIRGITRIQCDRCGTETKTNHSILLIRTYRKQLCRQDQE